MHRRDLFALLVLGTTGSSHARASDKPTHLEREQVLDAVRVDKKTGQVSFALLIDWPLDDPRTLNAVQRKLNIYYRARRQGYHVVQFPEVNPALPVGLHVFHLPAATERGRAALATIDRSARRSGFRPTFESRSGIEGPTVSRS
jgi:hypothetical protein